MKLKLEVFREIVVLQITDRIELNEMDLLLIGFNRLIKLSCGWLIIDLTHAQIDENVLIRFKEIRPSLETKLKNLILVGPSAELCKYQEILDAYHACQKEGSLEANFLIEKWSLEQKIKELNHKKEMATKNELSTMNKDSIKTEITRLRREKFRLKKLQSFLINDMVNQAYHSKKESTLIDGTELATKLKNYFLKIKLFGEELL